MMISFRGRDSISSRISLDQVATPLLAKASTDSMREKALKQRNADHVEYERHGSQETPVRNDITMDQFRSSRRQAEYEQYMAPIREARKNEHIETVYARNEAESEHKPVKRLFQFRWFKG